MVTKELQTSPSHAPQNGTGNKQIPNPEIPQVQGDPPYPVFLGMQLKLHHLLEKGSLIDLSELSEKMHPDRINEDPNNDARAKRKSTIITLNAMGTRYYGSGWALIFVDKVIDPKNKKIKKRSYLLMTREAYKAEDRLGQDSHNGIQRQIAGNRFAIAEMEGESQDNPSPADEKPPEKPKDAKERGLSPKPGPRKHDRNNRAGSGFDLQTLWQRTGEGKAKLSPEEQAEEKERAIQVLRKLLQLNLSSAIIIKLADGNLRFDQDIISCLQAAMPSDTMSLEEITGAKSLEELYKFFEISLHDTLKRWWNMEADIESIPLREKAAVAACRKLKTESTFAPLSMQDVLDRIAKRFSSPSKPTSSPSPKSPEG